MTSYSFAGVGCGFHKTYDLICVIDLAGSYEDHIEKIQSRTTKAEPHQKVYKSKIEPPTAYQKQPEQPRKDSYGTKI